jgi:hypothetical protein
MGKIRKFNTGATRDDDTGKLEPWGFTSPLVEKAFSEYMHDHRKQSDGSMRDSNNWKKGIPVDAYWHSLSRHILDFRLLYDGFPEEATSKDMINVLCAVHFNVCGLMYELLKAEYNAHQKALHSSQSNSSTLPTLQ